MARKISVSIIAAPEVEPWIALGIHDALWAVGVMWNRVMGEPEQPAFDVAIVAATPGPVRTATGVEIVPHRSVRDVPETDIVWAPSLLIESGGAFARDNPEILAWVRAAHARGARMVSSCTGSFLLAAAGLLDGREATTHWAFLDLMRAEYPAVRVRGNRVIVAADDDARIVTAGGATSWTDLVLYLVGRFVSEEEARRLAKMSLFDWHHQGQNPYARLMTRPQRDDAAIRRSQEWLADHYAASGLVGAMASRCNLQPRTFARRFKLATGYEPLEYVQRLRVEEGKQLLETSDLPVDEVAEIVGYHDSASFRRVFRRLVGESPAAYRRRNAVPRFVAELTERRPEPAMPVAV